MKGIIERVMMRHTDKIVVHFPDVKNSSEASKLVGKTVVFTNDKGKKFRGKITGVYGRWNKEVCADFGFKLSPFALGKEVELIE